MGKRKGSSAFPVARIKKMMQADDDVGKIATASPVLVGKALECMIEDVLTTAAEVARGRRSRTVSPGHLREAVDSTEKFDFLRSTLSKVVPLDPMPPQDNHSSAKQDGERTRRSTLPSKRARSPGASVAKRPRAATRKTRSPAGEMAPASTPTATAGLVGISMPALSANGSAESAPMTGMPAVGMLPSMTSLPSLEPALAGGAPKPHEGLRSPHSAGLLCADGNPSKPSTFDDEDEDYDDEDPGADHAPASAAGLRGPAGAAITGDPDHFLNHGRPPTQPQYPTIEQHRRTPTATDGGDRADHTASDRVSVHALLS